MPQFGDMLCTRCLGDLGRDGLRNLFQTAPRHASRRGALSRLCRSRTALRRFSARLRPPHRRRGDGVVLERLSGHGPASLGARGDGRGAARVRRRRRRHPQHLRQQPPPSAAGARARRSARPRSRIGLHLGLCRQRGGAVDPGARDARHGGAVGRAEPRLDDRRHPPQPRRKAHFPPQRPGRPGAPARSDRPRPAQARLLRVGLFDGWRYRSDRRAVRRGRSLSAR